MVPGNSTNGDESYCDHRRRSRAPIPRHLVGTLGGYASMRIARGPQRVLGDEAILIESQKTRDRANESAIENPAGQLIPLIFFDGFEKTRADARGGGDLVKRNAAHFTFTPKVFAERCRRHPQGPTKI
jgi:hypothetical protein